MSEINVELLETVMRHIDDHPEQHHQWQWMDECGTAACFAGWACLLSGWRPSLISTEDIAMSPDTLVERPIPDVAVDLLGLDPWDALRLFDADNTRPMLQLMVKDLINGEPLRDKEDYRDRAAS